MIIGATHGNEPAGYYCIKEMMNLLNKQIISLKKGKIIFVPVVNYCGYQLNKRGHSVVGDRLYLENRKMNIINKKIIKLSTCANFIIDFHEGWAL